MTLALEYLALDIKTLRYKEDFLKLKPPLQISGEQSGRFTVDSDQENHHKFRRTS